MRGFNQIIMLVIMVILGSSLLFLGLKTIGMVGGGIKDIEGVGRSERQKIDNMQGIASACNNWLYGDKYSAEAILNTYKLPDKMRPYNNIWTRCGEAIKELAQNCYKESESVRGCAGGGYLKASDPTLEACSNVCFNILKISEKCNTACSEKSGICFESIVSDAGSTIDDNDFEISSRELERGCR